ncbi:hypothetical protein OH491_05840 [Termitidicoccus mucosus]
MRRLKIVSAMLRNNATHDESLHHANQVRHGSWGAALVSVKRSA